MAFNENTRVKIPAILHLFRLGFDYLSLTKANWDIINNIFTEIYLENIQRINPEISIDDAKRLLQDAGLLQVNEDLGEAFFKMLLANNGTKILDLHDFSNNSFYVVTELTYKNGDDEFRPDITLLINGMPLAFIEVKKPNNHQGFLAERNRINVRFKNKKFLKFINIFHNEGKTSGIENLLFDSFVNSYYTLVPDDKIVDQFYNFMENIQKKKQTILVIGEKQLYSILNWLLPMLKNGQVTGGDSTGNKIKYEIEDEMRMAAELEGEKLGYLITLKL